MTLSLTKPEQYNPNSNWSEIIMSNPLLSFERKILNTYGNKVEAFYTDEFFKRPTYSKVNHIVASLKSLEEDLGIKLLKVSEIKEYFLKHIDMCDLTYELSYYLLSQFTNSACLTLDYYNDKEYNDEYLCLYIFSNKRNQEIIDIIWDAYKAFKREISRASGWIRISKDFEGVHH
ncbi:hypothetical protein [Kosmotoga pacifica]|uniref:Uncharacterized protein n=1 Tax=Kosmotoga pacifica TaxID=1330330 RepID=A0A0G2Z549_9BACT|nr:hypothetical protein [Kosmotoga pacifica]AKI96740.1 hypothetical protein IX53_01665 [Kosmotoga pacifica]